MISTEDLLEIKEGLEEKKAERERIVGASDAILESLAEKGIPSIKEAEKKIKNLSKKFEESQNEVDKKLSTFEEEYGEVIDELIG